MARPYERFPPGAKQHLESMAAHGLLSESAAATALGMPLDQFRRVIDENAQAKGIWQTCLAMERDQLFLTLFDRAKDGDTKAATTLLSIRHGLSERQPQAASAGVQVVFNLPQAMSPAEYMCAIQGSTGAQASIPHAGD